MKGWRSWTGAGLVGLLGGACANDLALSLEGKRCRSSTPRCVAGYVCDEARDVCVGDLSTAGSGGASAGEGGFSGGGDTGLPGGAAGAGAGGFASAGVGGLAGEGGAAGDGPDDAGQAADDAGLDSGSDSGCVPRLSYPDRDGDGVGVTAQAAEICPTEGWVTLPGDCRDDLPEVFLGQADYFDAPFPDPTKPAQLSFDYDCSGTEQPDPSNTPLDPAPACESLLAGVNCAGSGYLAATPARSGPGVDARCGSDALRTCVLVQALGCGSSDTAVAERFRCR